MRPGALQDGVCGLPGGDNSSSSSSSSCSSDPGNVPAMLPAQGGAQPPAMRWGGKNPAAGAGGALTARALHPGTELGAGPGTEQGPGGFSTEMWGRGTCGDSQAAAAPLLGGVCVGGGVQNPKKSPLPRAAERRPSGSRQGADCCLLQEKASLCLIYRGFNNSPLLGRNSLARNAAGSGAGGVGLFMGVSPPELTETPPWGRTVWGESGTAPQIHRGEPKLLLDPEPEQPPGTSGGAPGRGTAPCPRG